MSSLRKQLRTNLDRTGLADAIFSFADKIENYDAALIYYAGHGFQVDGDNILAPIELDIQARPELVKYNAFPLSELTEVLQRSHWTSGTVYHVLKNEKYKGTYVGAKFIMPVPCKHRVLRAPLEQQVRIEDSHAAIVTPEEFEQAQKVIMLQHGNHQAGKYTKHQYPLKGKVYCGYCQKLMKYRVLKKLGPSFNCRFSAAAVDSPCKRIPISEEILEHIVRNALTAQIKQAEHILEVLLERERKALIRFSALERQEEKLSAEKAEIVKQRVALYEQYADGNMSKEEFIRQRDAYRVQEGEKME